ncbi:hypothetical protein FQA39_LY06624 [Lamprigera yunnana]|nr:hypothetical protein FQA39_LY06624 [Lamprigera yunnana]
MKNFKRKITDDHNDKGLYPKRKKIKSFKENRSRATFHKNVIEKADNANKPQPRIKKQLIKKKFSEKRSLKTVRRNVTSTTTKNQNEINEELPKLQRKQADNQLEKVYENNDRTVFVGNVGVSVNKKRLMGLFKKYGEIESVRFRGITPPDPKTSKRIAAMKRMFHPKRTSLYSYIVFKQRDDALKAVQLNGSKLDENVIRVMMCDDNVEVDPKKAIFVGNIPLDAEENDLWSSFEQYGKIVSVRLIRNSDTGICTGVGFVNFNSADSVELVLLNETVQIKERVLRIKRYSKTAIKKSNASQSPAKLKTKSTKSKKANNKIGHSVQNKNTYEGAKFVVKKKVAK